MLNYFNPIKTNSLIVELKDVNRTKIRNLKSILEERIDSRYDLEIESHDTGHKERRGRIITTAYDIWNGKEIAMVVKIRQGYRTTRENEDIEINPRITLMIYDLNLKELYDNLKEMFKDGLS